MRLQCSSKGVPREEMEENSGETVTEEIIAKNFLELKRDMDLQNERVLNEFTV